MTEKILGINYGMIHTAAKKCYIPTLRVYICHLALNSETIQRRFILIHAPTEEKYVKTLRARVITNYNSYVALSLVRCGCTRQGRCSWRVLAQKENNLTEIFCCFGMLYGVRSAHNTNLHTICNNIAQNIVVSF